MEGGFVMIAYLCNKCHKPLDLKDEQILHLEIRMGERGVTSEGRYGSGWSADLCSTCAKELSPYIGESYYCGAKYVQQKAGE